MGEIDCLPPSDSDQARMKYDSLKHELDDLIEGARVVLAAKDAEIARLTDELAGTIKVREQAFEKIARIRAEVDAKHDYACRMDGLAEERNIEIQRLRAALARVTAQRDKVADHLHNKFAFDDNGWTTASAKRDADEVLAQYGLRIESGEVKEIET